MLISGRNYTVHAEMLIRPNTDVGQTARFYSAVDRVDLPRRPIKLSHPREAVQWAQSLSHRLMPHLVGYDYKTPADLRADLAYYENLGVRAVLMVKGEHPIQKGMETMQMLEVSREHQVAVGVAGAMPDSPADLSREFDYLAAKIEAGAQMVLTQPVHSLGLFEQYCHFLQNSKLSTFISFRPGVALWPSRMKAFTVSNLLSGVRVPSEDLKSLSLYDDKGDRGVGIAARKIQAIAESGLFDGFILFPFGNNIYQRLPDLLARFADITP